VHSRDGPSARLKGSVEGHPRHPDPSRGTQEQPTPTARGAVE
jgi:hypothetical protein